MRARLTRSYHSREDLQDAIHKAGLLCEENKNRWPANPVTPEQGEAVRLWDIKPGEVEKEENSQMTHD